MAVIPEEAEDILALFHKIKAPPTNLICYASPVTKKMLSFNNLTFYAVPSLPATWAAPMWLKIELGIFSGRLYFEYPEYDYLCHYLGIKESVIELERIEDDLGASEDVLTSLEEADIPDVVEAKNTKPGVNVFANKPLTFLLEW